MKRLLAIMKRMSSPNARFDRFTLGVIARAEQLLLPDFREAMEAGGTQRGLKLIDELLEPVPDSTGKEKVRQLMHGWLATVRVDRDLGPRPRRL